MSSVYFNPDPDLYPDPSGRAKRIIKFIENLTLWEGDFADEKFKVNEFQEAIIRRIYGPCDEDGNRLSRIVNIWIPRKNTKTTTSSALSLAHFMGPEAEPGGQVIMAAADRGNAGIAFNHAWQMIQKDSELSKRVNPIVSQKELHHLKTKSICKAISTEAYSKHGLNVSFFLADELHVWPPTEARKLWKVITDSMVLRSNPLTIVISTAGDGVGGLGYDMWEHSHKIARGEINDPTFVPIIFGANPEQDWKDEKTWYFANPVLKTKAGIPLLKELRLKFARTEFFPTDAADFKRFHLNIWQEGSATPWVDPDLYDQADEREDIEYFQENKIKGYIGVDLSSVEDLTCVSLVFPDREEEQGYDIFPMFFLPEENLGKKSDRDQANYLKWAKEGYLILTKGNRIDQKVIHDYVKKLDEDFNIEETSVDRWNSTAFITGLQDEGLEVTEFGQGFGSMAGPVREIKRSVLARKFRHGNNPIARMCFLNVVTEKDAAECEKFTKSKARGRIDFCSATAQAIGRFLVLEGENLKKKYRGFFSRKESIEKVYGKKKEEEKEDDEVLVPVSVSDSDWSPEILKDKNHPEFSKHLKIFERWQRKQERIEARMW